MLICPQCEFENLETNKFCQNCGSSLTHKACQDCETEVLANAATCHNCGAFTGTVWWAVVSGISPPTLPSAGTLEINSEITSEPDPEITSEPDPVITPELVYLDRHQRYQILETQTWENNQSSEWQGSILDCQPLQISDLATRPQIPAIAQAYLDLRSSFIQTLPLVQDTWEAAGQSVVLLEDRSQWQLLSDLWGSAEIPIFQVLYWLEEIALLWEALTPWQQQHSLLELGNLHVDEDQALSLQCLYPNPTLTTTSGTDVAIEPLPPTLAELGKALLSLSPPSPHLTINQLLEELVKGDISTTVALQNKLAALHQQVETPPVPVEEEFLFPETDTFIQTDKTKINSNYQSSRTSDDSPTVVLPMQLLSLDDAGYTDIGQQRDHNEDNFGIQVRLEKQEHPMGKTIKARGLYVLCDGMGGHAAGEVASSLAVETLKHYFQEAWQDKIPSQQVIMEGVVSANQVIYDVNQQKSSSGSGRMGTTLAMMILQDTNVAIAHVGDSRVYRITRRGGLEQLTTDHEVGQREIRRGVEPDIAYSRPDAYQLTQALGPRSTDFIKPDVQFFEVNEDSLFILCSDGLSDNDLLEKNWESYLTPLLSSRANLNQGVSRLIEFANEQNGHDNITVLLVRVKVQPIFEQQQMF